MEYLIGIEPTLYRTQSTFSKISHFQLLSVFNWIAIFHTNVSTK